MKINNTQAVAMLKSHIKSIVNKFPTPNHRQTSIWLQAVAEELSYLLLIAYVDLTQSKGMDNYKKQQLDKLVDDWSGIIAKNFYLEDNVNIHMTIKQKLNQKTQDYSPIIDNILGEQINRNKDDEIAYKYQLYELFLNNVLDNFTDKFSQKPRDGIMGSMNFINSSQDVEIVRQFVFDEKSIIMLSLSIHDTDNITEFDKFTTSRNQDKKATRKRAIAIRDGVVHFITQCIYYDKNNHSNNYQTTNQINDTGLFDGYLSPTQYFLSAIIPCFLILAINDSMYLFPPNLSIPIFSIGDKIRELNNNQEFGLWVSYLVAVANLLYLQIKRLKDSDKHPALCLISFVPFFGSLFTIALAISGQFPSHYAKDDTMENDPHIGISYMVSVFALIIFIFIWLGATP